jgi:hypothetical protein
MKKYIYYVLGFTFAVSVFVTLGLMALTPTSNTRGDIMETITKIKVIRILKNHGHNNYNELKDFIKDLGNKEIYKLQQVKDWLGY